MILISQPLLFNILNTVTSWMSVILNLNCPFLNRHSDIELQVVPFSALFPLLDSIPWKVALLNPTFPVLLQLNNIASLAVLLCINLVAEVQTRETVLTRCETVLSRPGPLHLFPLSSIE